MPQRKFRIGGQRSVPAAPPQSIPSGAKPIMDLTDVEVRRSIVQEKRRGGLAVVDMANLLGIAAPAPELLPPHASAERQELALGRAINVVYEAFVARVEELLEREEARDAAA